MHNADACYIELNNIEDDGCNVSLQICTRANNPLKFSY